MRTLIFILVCLSLAGCVAEVEIAGSSEEIICGREDWAPVQEFNDAHSVAAQYGLAAAFIGPVIEHNGSRFASNDSVEICSAALISRTRLITADHCVNNDLDIEARFGELDETYDDYIRQRLLALGASADADIPSVRTFRCRLIADTSDLDRRDLAVYECGGVEVPGLGSVYPGDVWGWFEMEARRRSEGTGTSVVSYNHLRNESRRQQLYSPSGSVTDARDGCGSGRYERCFEFSSDIRAGSSGGPILDRGTNRLFGVAQAQWGDDGETCSAWGFDTNYGTYLPPRRRLTVVEIPDLRSLPSESRARTTTTAGTPAGRRHAISCPDGYAAGGILGQGSWWTVNNFGVICVPVTRSGRRSTSHWRVIASGSEETGSQAGSYPFNEYMHEYLDPRGSFSRRQQAFQMCPLNSYLEAVQITEQDSYIGSVAQIRCIDDRGRRVGRRPSRIIGMNWNRPLEWVSCGPGRAVSRLNFSEDGERVRSFSFGCRSI